MNRNDRHQPQTIVRTGVPHIEREIQMILAISDHLPDGALAIDAGANIGLISIPLAQRLASRGGVVFAFEPQRLTYYMLAGNTALAGLENLVCHQLALGEAPGMLSVPILNPHIEQDFGMVSLGSGEGDGDLIQSVTIDMLDLGRLDFLKIDVEHMELAVLSGGVETIHRYRPLIWIEVWPQHYAAIFAWFSQRNYTMLIVDALNFCAVPAERLRDFPIAFQGFDGVDNPYARQAGFLPFVEGDVRD